jgi:cytochrome c biogenesis protein CcmG/thiol:disulfide interchange protein DsbE
MESRKILLTVLLLIAAACAKKEVAVDHPAPDFKVLDTLTGQKLSSSDLENKVIFVNFWASWCEPCKEEMPSIESLYREMSSQKDFRMVTILYRDSPWNALGYLKMSGYTFPVFTDTGEISAKNFGVTGVPETYVIDKKRVLKMRVIGGADWNSPVEKGIITSLLKE